MDLQRKLCQKILLMDKINGRLTVIKVGLISQPLRAKSHCTLEWQVATVVATEVCCRGTCWCGGRCSCSSSRRGDGVHYRCAGGSLWDSCRCCAHGSRVACNNLAYVKGAYRVEPTPVPFAGVNVESHVDLLSGLNVETCYAVGAEHLEHHLLWILVVSLQYVFLCFPLCTACACAAALWENCDDFSLYFHCCVYMCKKYCCSCEITKNTSHRKTFFLFFLCSPYVFCIFAEK